MVSIRNAKAAMLAVASVMAASAALSPAGASDLDPVAYPQVVSVEASAAHADEAAQNQKIGPKRWALLAAAAASLAALTKLIGARRMGEIVREGAVRTARATATGTKAAVRTVGRAVSSPFRFLAILFGLALFALTGIGLFDVEWIGGLLSGAGLVGAGLYGMWKTKRVLRPIRVKTKPESFKANEN